MTTANNRVLLSNKSRISKNINHASSVFFAIGFLIKRLEVIPIPLVKNLMHLIYAGCYMLAYGLFSVASVIFPKHTARKRSWYDRLRVQDQMGIAGILGIVGSALILASLYFAPLLCIGLGLMAISNFAWFCGEVHRLKHPSTYETNDKTAQSNYAYYAGCVLAISILTLLPEIAKLAALSAAGGIGVMCTIVIVALAIIGCVFWLKSVTENKAVPTANAPALSEEAPEPGEQTQNLPAPSFTFTPLFQPANLLDEAAVEPAYAAQPHNRT